MNEYANISKIQAYQGNIEKRYEVKVPTTSKMMQILKKKHDKRVPSQYTNETCYDSFTLDFQRANLSDIKKLENIVDEFRKNIFDYFIKVYKYEIMLAIARLLIN
ncbi:hypothetical protein KSF78_0008997 [Schistosoma japonicum]|nr:hypothetical protein KSF78_0008997 [Schistosoma japonicum]